MFGEHYCKVVMGVDEKLNRFWVDGKTIKLFVRMRLPAMFSLATFVE
jgi:hypothetical protein